MKFFNYKSGIFQGIGIKSQDGLLRGLNEKDANFPGTLESLIVKGKDLNSIYALLEKAPQLREDKIQFLPLVEKPSKIVCIGLNYADHAKEAGQPIPDYPSIFLRNANSLLGHKQDIIHPTDTNSLDYEAELAFIIGKQGRHIKTTNALEYVTGYSIFNDVSVREFQFKSTQWTMGKNFDATGPLGPFLVTPEELPKGASGLNIMTRLNGTVLQKSNTDQLIFSVAKIIEILSRVMTLEPGDIIITGTPAGVGAAREPKLYMHDGDVCEVEIEGIGVLRNTIKDEAG